jgi:hypothetical protein
MTDRDIGRLLGITPHTEAVTRAFERGLLTV